MKIINIALSDNFKDILEEVRRSESSRVILIVPKSNRVFKNKNRVEKLKFHFDKLGKEISIISSGQEAVKNASLAGFNILRETGKISEKNDKDILSFYSEPSGKPDETKPKESKKFISILLGSAIASFAFIVLTSLSEADIKIIPRKNDFSVNIPVIVSDKITKNDEIYGMIPGEWIEVEKVVSKTFVSSAEKEVFQKTQGRITIYNNLSTSPQILVATTRFQTPEGLVFRIPRTITIPGATKIGNELEPGKTEVEVTADRAGEEYNIEPSDFRVPGFLGSPKYQGFYAKSFKKFSGGFVGRSSFLSKADLEKAEEETRQEAIKETRIELASLSNFRILDETVDIQIERTSDSNRAGDLVKEFVVSLKVKAAAMAFKEEDVINFISQYVKNSQDTLVIRNSLEINYDKPELNREERTLSFKLSSSGQAIQNIDKGKMISEIAGKRKEEISSYLNDLSGVESAQIFSPFWLRRIPKSNSRINIEIIVE